MLPTSTKLVTQKQSNPPWGTDDEEGGIGVTIAGVIATGWTGGEENNNEETDDKDEGVKDDKENYNAMVAIVTIVTTITTTLLLA